MFYEYCVYTITRSSNLNQLLLTTQEGTITEKTNWASAKKLFEEAQFLHKDFIVVFAPAEATMYLHSWAIITNIVISDDKSHTEYSFKNLTQLHKNKIEKSRLILKNSGKNLAQEYIRPYVLCNTPVEIIEKESTAEKISEKISFKNTSPYKQETVVNKFIRNDSDKVQFLKKYWHYKCQFPGCTARIQTKNGPDYVEVAHIIPVAEGGESEFGNLLVLCPNHHKEFDEGNLEILCHDKSHIEGRLNGKYFNINMEVKEIE
jgi:5-methylcytosine-specific restriction endonuclease McrA